MFAGELAQFLLDVRPNRRQSDAGASLWAPCAFAFAATSHIVDFLNFL
jgi:hypothetical protein